MIPSFHFFHNSCNNYYRLACFFKFPVQSFPKEPCDDQKTESKETVSFGSLQTITF